MMTTKWIHSLTKVSYFETVKLEKNNLLIFNFKTNQERLLRDLHLLCMSSVSQNIK